jgi:alcohol dehydrogenase
MVMGGINYFKKEVCMTAGYRFHCPVKIVSGQKALDKLPNEFRQIKGSRPMVVTDKGVAQAGLLDIIHKVGEGSELAIGGIYDRVPPDSPVGAVLEIAELFGEKDCDCILAVGGGSAIDAAKAVGIKLAAPDIELMNFKAVLRMTNPTPPLIAIPTTAGTGSEVTSAAVISDPDKDIKLSLLSPSMPPNTAIIDPRMTRTLPPRLTAATGMDALTHAVEACLGIQKNPISDAVASSAISLISGNLIEAVKNGENMEARLAMADAATMAGIAFSNSMVTMVHAIGHSLGAIYHLPHGEAMAICLPDVLEFNLDVVGPHVAQLLIPLAGAGIYADTAPEKRAHRAIEIIREMLATLNELSGLPVTLKQAGLSRDKLEDVAKISVSDGAAHYNRKKFTPEDAMVVLEKIYE